MLRHEAHHSRDIGARERLAIAVFTYLKPRGLFTVNLAERHNNRLLIEHTDALRSAFSYVKRRKPFTMEAVVIMPDHLHTIWRLPPNDADYSSRWSLVKSDFSRAIPCKERVSVSRKSRRERGIWQRRYWAHLLTSQEDFNNHCDYIHWNPVKNGHTTKVADWPYSSFHQYVAAGLYPAHWGHSGEFSLHANE